MFLSSARCRLRDCEGRDWDRWNGRREAGYDHEVDHPDHHGWDHRHLRTGRRRTHLERHQGRSRLRPVQVSRSLYDEDDENEDDGDDDCDEEDDAEDGDDDNDDDYESDDDNACCSICF